MLSWLKKKKQKRHTSNSNAKLMRVASEYSFGDNIAIRYFQTGAIFGTGTSTFQKWGRKASPFPRPQEALRYMLTSITALERLFTSI
jgi:hypothetical protein